MQHLIRVWSEVVKEVRDAGHILALFDYDGTLAPIAERPELATLPSGTRMNLEELARRSRFTVGIMSGRSLSDLKNIVNIDGIIYSGNHGLEIEAPEVRLDYPLAGEIETALQNIHELLLGSVGKIAGVLVDNKRLSLSVHYRRVPQDRIPDVRRAFGQALKGFELPESLQVMRGKKIYEVRPAGWDKGSAVGLLIDKFGGFAKNLLPIYLGDDWTDEDAFRALPDDSISVFVGGSRRRSAARYFLRSPSEVAEFLAMLLREA